MDALGSDNSLGVESLDVRDLSDGISTSRTLRNIKKSLIISLEKKYGSVDQSVIEGLLKIHGVHQDNFDFVKNIGLNVSENIADISIDSNSNKTEKTIEGIVQEVIFPVKKLLGLDYLYRVIKSKFGKERAYSLMGDMLDFSLGLSDATNILKPYCWAMDATKLVTIGKPFGQLKSSPSHKLRSYISNLTELIHHISGHIAGAVAVGTFFLDISHICIYYEKFNFVDLKNEKLRKHIADYYQQFIHSVNHLSRSSVESPFVNISVFDRDKLQNLLKPDNFGWYFSDYGQDETIDAYIIEYILEIQKIFLEFFDKGDPLSNGMPYRFPVVTLNISKTVDGGISNNDFLCYITNNLDIHRYNIFSSEGMKIASCCRLLSNVDMLDMASQSNSFGGSSVSLGSHRVLTINFNRIANEAIDIDDYYRILAERVDNAACILSCHKELLNILTDEGLQPFLKNKWIQMDRLFSTFGLLGLYEASITMHRRFGISEDDIMHTSLIFVNKQVSEVSTKYNIVGNIEQIPAESFAIRLAEADRLIFGKEAVPFKLYSNQFIPLWEDATIWERMKKDGMYNKLITGGGIVHVTIGDSITPTQARSIIEFSIKSGCDHFALNAVYSACESNHMSFGKHSICPICSGSIVDYFTRIIGYFVPVSTWGKVRREWEFPNRSMVNVV